MNATDEAMTPDDSAEASGRSELSFVKKGLGLVYWGIVIWLLAAIMLVASTRVPVLKNIVTGMWYLSIILAVSGKLMCLKTPANTGGRGFIFAAVGMDALAFLLQLWLLYIAFSPAAAAGISVSTLLYVKLGSSLLPLAAFVMFVLFVRMIASYINRQDLAKSAMVVLILGLALIPLAIASVVILFASVSAGLLAMLFAVILGIVFVVRYGNLMGYTSKAI